MASRHPFEDPHFRQYVATVSNIAKAMKPAIEATQHFQTQFGSVLDQLPRMDEVAKAIKYAAAVAKQELRDACPDNWDGFDVDIWQDAVHLGADHGISVVWAPRAEIVRELIEAPDAAARKCILRDREGDILRDVELVLADVAHEDLGHFPGLGRDALAAYRDGHPKAAHALAAAVLSGAVHELFHYEKFSEARDDFLRRHPMSVEVRNVRIITVVYALGRALEKTDVAPPGFNRHASLHGHADQYEDANAIRAMLLLAGVLREVDLWSSRQDRERDAA